MKKLISIAFTLVLVATLSVPSFSQDNQSESEQGYIKGLKLGLSLGFYHQPDELSKELYGAGNLMYGAYFAFDFTWRFEVRIELNRFKDKGAMSVSKEETRFFMTQYVLGTRFRILGGDRKLLPYVGAGITPSTFREEFPERFKDYVGSTHGAYHIEAGIYLKLKDKIRLDFNFRYVKADVNPFDEVIHLGGIRFGVGIEYRF